MTKIRLRSTVKKDTYHEITVSEYKGKAYVTYEGRVVAEITAETMEDPEGKSPGFFLGFFPRDKSICDNICDVFHETT